MYRIKQSPHIYIYSYRIGGIMVSVLTSNVVDRGFESRSAQTKNYKIDICCFSAKHKTLRRKSKYWLGQNHDNVSEWSDISSCELLFQWTSTIKISSNITCYRHDKAEKKILIWSYYLNDCSGYNFVPKCAFSTHYVHDQTFRFITWQPSIERASTNRTWVCAGQLCGFNPGKHHHIPIHYWYFLYLQLTWY